MVKITVENVSSKIGKVYSTQHKRKNRSGQDPISCGLSFLFLHLHVLILSLICLCMDPQVYPFHPFAQRIDPNTVTELNLAKLQADDFGSFSKLVALERLDLRWVNLFSPHIPSSHSHHVALHSGNWIRFLRQIESRCFLLFLHSPFAFLLLLSSSPSFLSHFL